MIENTISFLFLMSCYYIIAATIFTMRFGTVDEALYGTVFDSIRSLFDDMVTNFSYQNFGKYDRSHSMFLMCHLIITTIFLL
jgi:hypothetical protein